MIQLDYLKSLIKVFEESDLAELRLKDETAEIELKARGDITCVAGSALPVGRAGYPQAINTEVAIPSAAAATVNPTAAAAETDIAINSENMEIVKSPIVGTFYEAPGAGQPPYVTVGEHVNAGDTLCIIESMKMMNELAAPVSGVIRSVKVENETFVTAGAELFVIETV